jgi:hypothetical protein
MNAATASAFRVVKTALSDKFRLSKTPSNPDTVPGSAEVITRAWLSSVVCRDVPDAMITNFIITGGSDGTSSRRSIELSYNESGLSAGLPKNLFAKTSASLSTRMLLGMTGIVEGESLFFNELRPLLNLRSPRSYHAACDVRTCRSVVLLEDLSKQGWTFPSPMSNSISETDARDMVDQMAIYHAAFWGMRQSREVLKKLRTPLQIQERLNRIASFPHRTSVGLTRAKSVVPPALWSRRSEIWPAVMQSLKVSELGPQTLLHQDVHVGNWLRDQNGRMGLYDWQIVARGHWAIDVSYALIVALDRADRRLWERDLLRLYIQRLKEYGVVDPPDLGTAYRDYCRHPMHAYAFGVFTNGQPWYLPQLQPPDYTLRSAERILCALEDLKR